MSVHGFEYRTRSRRVPPSQTGYGARLEIEDRESRQRAIAAARKAEPSMIDRERAKAEESAAARDWVQRVGFDLRLQSLAISAALELRAQLGAGAVTKRMVTERMRARWPSVFDDEQNDRAA